MKDSAFIKVEQALKERSGVADIGHAERNRLSVIGMRMVQRKIAKRKRGEACQS